MVNIQGNNNNINNPQNRGYNQPLKTPDQLFGTQQNIGTNISNDKTAFSNVNRGIPNSGLKNPNILFNNTTNQGLTNPTQLASSSYTQNTSNTNNTINSNQSFTSIFEQEEKKGFFGSMGSFASNLWSGAKNSVQDVFSILGIGSSKDMTWPVDNKKLSSSYGYRTHPILGGVKFHKGIDIGAKAGSPIYAAKSGVVTHAGYDKGYGNYIVVDHGNGLTTRYAHASKLYVQEGQRISQGQSIAAVGSTGLSTGPHIHFEVRLNGNAENPMRYLSK